MGGQAALSISSAVIDGALVVVVAQLLIVVGAGA
jgi:hypothetical protein